MAIFGFRVSLAARAAVRHPVRKAHNYLNERDIGPHDLLLAVATGEWTVSSITGGVTTCNAGLQ